MTGTDAAHPRTIIVVGEGKVTAVPDRCIISASFHVTRDTVADAIAAVSALAGTAIAALLEAGVKQSDLATQDLGVHDRFDHERQQITARVATYSFSLTARDLGDVSRLVHLLTDTAADALEIHGISFSHSEPEPLRVAARRAAVLDARARAEQLAAAAGLQLGEVLTIDEGSGAGGGWFGRAISGGPHEMSAAAFPINPGGHAVSVRVVVTYALG